jgi:hypothetical protein
MVQLMVLGPSAELAPVQQRDYFWDIEVAQTHDLVNGYIRRGKIQKWH